MSFKFRRILALTLCMMLTFGSAALMEEPTVAQGDSTENIDVPAGEGIDPQVGEPLDDPEAPDIDAAENEASDAADESPVAADAVDVIIAEAEGMELVEAGDVPEDVEIEELAELPEAVEATEAMDATADDPYSSLFEPAAGDLLIDESSFPDANFRTFVKKFDIDNNGYLSETERNNVTGIDVLDKMTSLKGIENFPNLQSLDCGGNTLTELDVSGNTKLESLLCSENSLATLTLGTNTSLKMLSCAKNKLTALNISGCGSLAQLSCEDNSLTTLDITQCAALVAVVDTTVNTPVYDGQTVMYGKDGGNFLKCDASVTITGGNPASPTTATTTENTVSKITITKKNSKRTVNLGTTYQIDLGTYTGKKFKSSNKKVARVSSAGLITLKKRGKTKITFKVGKKKCTLTLKVVDPTIPTKVTLDQSGTVKATKGESVTLTATIPEGTTSTIKWKTSNKKVATVNQSGEVTFKKKGTVYIAAVATRGKKYAMVKFKVT